MRAIKDIEIKLSQLTPELIQELERYLDYLINKCKSKQTRRLKQDWAGGLKGEKYTSIDLQKRALDWRQK